jgi:hypothetical protein
MSLIIDKLLLFTYNKRKKINFSFAERAPEIYLN